MKVRVALPVLLLSGLMLAGCMTAEERKAADEERCRSYGFKHRNDAFAQCMQRIDMARRARLNDRPYYVDGPGPVVIID